MNKLDGIRKRLYATTDGEWLPCGDKSTIASDLTGEENPTFICANGIVPEGMKSGNQVADLKFILHAPDDIGYLLQLLDRLIERQ